MESYYICKANISDLKKLILLLIKVRKSNCVHYSQMYTLSICYYLFSYIYIYINIFMYFLHCIALKPDKNFNLEIKFAWKQK